jgi:hypothetical protein
MWRLSSPFCSQALFPSVYEGKPKLELSYNKEMRCPHKGTAIKEQHRNILGDQEARVLGGLINTA